MRDPKEEIKTTPIYSILSLNYLIFLAFVMFISGFFTFAAIGFTILSITPIVILFHRNPDWKKLAVSFTLWFAVIYLIARISRHEMATAYLALFACSNIVISILLWLFISGRMTIQNLVMSLSVYAGLIIVTVMAAQNMGHDVIGMLTHRIEIYIGSIITSLKKYNLQDADQQNLLFLQEMAISFVKTCPAALIYITVLLAGFLNLFLRDCS